MNVGLIIPLFKRGTRTVDRSFETYIIGYLYQVKVEKTRVSKLFL